MIRMDEKPLYIIERFDRIIKNQSLKRLHQEDFCQGLGLLSDQKYENEGGPSLAKCAELIKKYSINAAFDLKNFIRWVVFNYIVGNHDAHGKNLSFILSQHGPYLSPFYDILSTEIYPDLSPRFAMKIGGEYRSKWIQPRHWERFSKAIEIKFDIIQSTIKDFQERYFKEQPTIQNILTEFEKHEKITIQQILSLIEHRLKVLNAVL